MIPLKFVRRSAKDSRDIAVRVDYTRGVRGGERAMRLQAQV